MSDLEQVNGRSGREHAAVRLAQGLGWFSLGLGAVELAAPRAVARAFGLEGKEALIGAYGAREIAAGLAILSGHRQLGMWSRVGGDLLDLATLAVGMRGADRSQRRKAGVAIAAVAGVTMLDTAVAGALGTRRRRSAGNESGSAVSAGPDFDRAAAPDLPKVQVPQLAAS